MQRRSLIALSSIIFIGSLELTTLPELLMEIFAGVNAVIVAFYLLFYHNKLAIPKSIAISIGVIWSIYIGHMILAGISGSLLIYTFIRVPVFLSFIVFFIFLVPQSTSSDTFLYILPRFGAFLTPIGLISLAVGGFTIGPLEIAPYHAEVPVFPLFDHPRVQAMTAVFKNPNTLSLISGVALVSGVTEFDRDKSMTAAALIGLNLIGLRLSGSRSVQVGVMIALGVYFSYRVIGRWFALLALFSGISGILMIITVSFDPSLTLPIFPDVDLNSRAKLWRGALRSVSSSPYFGVGLIPSNQIIKSYTKIGGGVHSSYIYILMSSGVVGLVGYIYIYGRTIISGILTSNNQRAMAVYATAIVPMISSGFDTYSILGVTMLPAVTALTLGYGIKEWIKSVNSTALASDSST